MNSPVSIEVKENIAVITIDNSPVNALSQGVREGILNGINQAQKQTNTKAILIRCVGKTFIAGADITEFSRPPLEPHLPDVIQTIINSKIPVVALLFGHIFGGGFETALACHYRLAVSGSKCGLPEVTLGLIPGAGGTQMLPRLGGIELSLDMILTGKPKTAETLLKHNVIDVILEKDTQDNLLNKALEFTLEKAKSTKVISQITMIKTPQDEELFAHWASKINRKMKGQIAPKEALLSIKNTLSTSFQEGMKLEREHFLLCRGSTQSAAMRHAFFAEKGTFKSFKNHYNNIDKPATNSAIKSVAVIGAGTMGIGIAMCFAQAGFKTYILEINADNLQKGLTSIAQGFQQSVKRGLISTEDAQKYQQNIIGTCHYSDLKDVDLVVEAAFETMAIKHEIFKSLDEVCKKSAILATNTSYLNIDEIASVTNRASHVIGMHFFSPANIMKLLEVVKAKHTDIGVLNIAMNLAKDLNKISVMVKNGYGFVGNRMYACYGREANMLLLEGASVKQIDTAMKEFGMAMGPLEVNDMSGIDIAYKARKDNLNANMDPLYFKAANAMVEAGRLGKKTVKGFYSYSNEAGKATEDPQVSAIILSAAQSENIKQRVISNEEIQQRLIYAIINEGANLLQDNIALCANDIDVIWLNGYGFPRYKGGPMYYAKQIGVHEIISKINKFAQSVGGQYWRASSHLQNL